MIHVKQFEQGGAENNNILSYNVFSGLWEVNTEFIATPVSDDKSLTPNITIGDGQDTGITITKTPIGSGISLQVNGVLQNLGDGVSTLDGYFSGDGGLTVRDLSDVQLGDALYWNGVTAGFDLDGSDRIDLNYNVATDGSDGGAVGQLELIEKIEVAIAATSVTFSGLNGETDPVYYLTGRILPNSTSSRFYELQPNSSAVLDRSMLFNYFGSGLSVSYRSTSLAICSTFGHIGIFEGIFHAKKIEQGTSFYRGYTGRSTTANETTNYVQATNISGVWYDNTTTITSLKIAGSANSILAGSEFYLYKLLQQ
jgi:hypothetical protein